MTDTPAQAPADPGAIDLDALQQRRGRQDLLYEQRDCLPLEDLDALFAAVEALRERAAELEVANDAVQEAADFNLRENLALAKRMADTRAEAAEARCAELAGALEGLLFLPVSEKALGLLDKGIGTKTPNNAWLIARAALAVTRGGGS